MKKEEAGKDRRAAGRAVMQERIRKQAGRAVRGKARKDAEKERARRAAEKEKARKEAERERARREAEKEKARKEAEREKARKEAEKERARKDAEREKARKEAEKERARKDAERERARKEAERERVREKARREAARGRGTKGRGPRSPAETLRARIAASRPDDRTRQGVYAVWMDRIGRKDDDPSEEPPPWDAVLGASYGFLGGMRLIRGVLERKTLPCCEGLAFLTLSGAYFLKDRAARIGADRD